MIISNNERLFAHNYMGIKYAYLIIFKLIEA